MARACQPGVSWTVVRAEQLNGLLFHVPRPGCDDAQQASLIKLRCYTDFTGILLLIYS